MPGAVILEEKWKIPTGTKRCSGYGDRQADTVSRPARSRLGSTHTITHVRTGSRSQETSDEAVSVAVDLHLLAWLAHRLEERLLRVHGADVDVAVGQRGHGWTPAVVCHHYVVGAVGGACADAGGCAAGAGAQRVEGLGVREARDITDRWRGDGSARTVG